ncbi:hypothetical protein DITRI_Ditri16bG0130300 [Diplodiscus trichospermus]
MEDDKQQKSADNQHQQQKHPEEQEHKQQQQQQQQQQQGQHHQEQQNHHEEEKQQQKEEQEKQEEEAENKQNQTVSQFPLSKRSTPPRTIPKAQLPPSDPSPVDSPLSSDRSSLSHGFSPPPTTASQPSDPNSKPPALAVFTADFTSTDQSTAATVEVEEQKQKLGSGSGKKLRPDLSILRKTKRDKMVRKALLGFRISGFAFCLVSFSVLAADKDQGWSLDSFYRYKEFRFCMAVNVIGFVYSAIQAYDLAYQLASGKQKPRSRLRCFLDFVLDQVILLPTKGTHFFRVFFMLIIIPDQGQI